MSPPSSSGMGKLPQPTRKRRLRFRNPFSLGTISESGDHIPSSKTTPLIKDKWTESGLQFSTFLSSTGVSPIMQAGEGPPNLTGKLQDVVSSESERTTGALRGLLLASGESKRIISPNDHGQTAPSRQLTHILQAHSPERVWTKETTMQATTDLEASEDLDTSREVLEPQGHPNQSNYPRSPQDNLQVLGVDIDLAGPREEVVRDDEESDNCGESFFEGFYSDTESCDGTPSIISFSRLSSLSYFNRSQQSGLQSFTMAFPAGISERAPDPSDQDYKHKIHTMTTIRDEPSTDINRVRRETGSMLVERKSLIATHRIHNSLMTLSDANAGEYAESSKYYNTGNDEEGEEEATTTWVITGRPKGPPRSPHPRTSGLSHLTPSQAEDVEFETRLANYSDDELNSMNTISRKMTKKERRQSRDDAWVDILVASHSRRAGNQDAELRRPGGPRPRNASRQDPEVANQEVAQVLAGIRGPSPPFDGESVDIEPMNVPRRSRVDSTGTVLDDIYEPAIPGSVDLAEPEDVQDPKPRRPQRRIGYFDLYPERRHLDVSRDGEEILDQFTQTRRATKALPLRGDTTESDYSSDPMPPASPKQVVTRLNTERLYPDPAVGLLSSPSPVSAPTPSPQTLTYTQRGLRRQQEVRDRLPGKPGPKTSSLIEMYREKERQAIRSKGFPGKSAGTSSQEKPVQLPALVAKESAPLPDLFTLDFPGMKHKHELEGDGEDYVEPTNFRFGHNRDSPFRYVHGAPLENVVEEE